MSISSIVLAALLSASPRVHHVEGIYAVVTLAADGRTATLEIAYPSTDGARVDRYAGSFTVRVDPELRALIHAGDQARGRVRLERADGERAWHVTAFGGDLTEW